ncbi:hypothetical protein LY76DRAFT_26466 [Colletotrichum caudatum]|nr:hypothetical protein LY76DRAFT_26466 [Colletotrichum caudatum]
MYDTCPAGTSGGRSRHWRRSASQRQAYDCIMSLVQCVDAVQFDAVEYTLSGHNVSHVFRGAIQLLHPTSGNAIETGSVYDIAEVGDRAPDLLKSTTAALRCLQYVSKSRPILLTAWDLAVLAVV